MTVPTNNEEALVTAEQKAWDELARLTSGSGPAANWKWSIPANPDRDSDLILSAGLKAVADERDALAAILAARRPPVSGDNAELIAEGIRCGLGPDQATDYGDQYRRLIYRLTSALSASQPREVEVSGDTVAAAVERIKARLSWASMHWGVEGLHPDALPHIARAALGGGDHAE